MLAIEKRNRENPMARKPTKKIKHISLKVLRKKSWDLISLFVRKSSADGNGIVRCYTCDKPHYYTDMDCGHYIHRDCLDYEPDNLKPQCNFCNRCKHGNLGIFAEKLIKEIGEKRVEALRQKSNEVKKFIIIELQDLIAKYTKLLETLGGPNG